jgi:hypothetical protein
LSGSPTVPVATLVSLPTATIALAGIICNGVD